MSKKNLILPPDIKFLHLNCDNIKEKLDEYIKKAMDEIFQSVALKDFNFNVVVDDKMPRNQIKFLTDKSMITIKNIDYET